MKNILSNNTEAVFKMTQTLNIKLKEHEKSYQGKELIKAVFMKWLNAGNTLLEMIVT